MTPRVREVLSWYAGESPAFLNRLARLLGTGHMAGSGQLLLATLDDGVALGPAEAYGYNRDAYNPSFLFRAAVDSKASAMVAPTGMLQSWVKDFAGEVSILAKINHYATLSSGHSVLSFDDWDQLDWLGVDGVSLSLPVGGALFAETLPMVRAALVEARRRHWVVTVQIHREILETDDVYRNALPLNELGYVVHLLVQAGVHVISVPKIEPPSSSYREFYAGQQIRVKSLQDRSAHLLDAAMAGQRLILGQALRGQEFSSVCQDFADMLSGGIMGFDIGPMLGLQSLQETRERTQELSRILTGNECK